MSLSLLPQPNQYYEDDSGRPLNGGQLFTYAPGTTTNKATYQDAAGTIPNTNPIILNARGEATVYGSGTYRVVLKNSMGATIWDRDNVVAPGLTQADGSASIGFIQAGAGAVVRTAEDKMRDLLSVRDFGAVVDGTTDDGTAIINTRAQAVDGRTILYGGKIHALDFWANLAPLAQEWILGQPTAYATTVLPDHPLLGGKMFQGTPTLGAGYAGYQARFDTYTRKGVDVASTVTALFSMQSYSTNSSGTNFNNTNQVALVANSSAMDADASASVEAINSIAFSGYTGALPQAVIGIESDIGANRAPGWFGAASAAYGVAFSAVINGSTQDITCAYLASGDGTHAFLHGLVAAGNRRVGVTVARDGATTPETGVWVASAGSFGIYVGAKNKWPLNPGSIANYTYKPAIGIALGQEGPTSAKSHTLRFTNTDGSGNEQNADLYANSAGAISMDFAGVNRFLFSNTGQVYQGGVQILTGRQTGYSPFTGSNDTGTVFNTSTVTLQQLAQRVAALQVSLTNHGLIGP